MYNYTAKTQNNVIFLPYKTTSLCAVLSAFCLKQGSCQERRCAQSIGSH